VRRSSHPGAHFVVRHSGRPGHAHKGPGDIRRHIALTHVHGMICNFRELYTDA